MGRFPSSVVCSLGFLVCLVQHVCPLLVFPGVQVYNNPMVTGVRYGMAPRFPVSGKTFVTSSSRRQNTGAVIQARTSPGFVATVIPNRQSNPNIISISSRRSALMPARSMITGSSLASISSLPTITSYRPSISQIRTRNIIPGLPAGKIYKVANPFRRQITAPMVTSRHMTQLTGSGPTASQILGRNQIMGRTSAGISLSKGPSPGASSSSGLSKVGIPIKKPAFKPIVPSKPPVKTYTGKSTLTSTKKYTKTSKRRSSRRSKKSRSSKDKARRKAELKAKLQALREKKMKKNYVA